MSPSPSNPFRPAEQTVPKVKALVFGPPGIGKTWLSLTAPGRIAVIDTEGGTAFYARFIGRGLSQFDVLPTKTYRDVQAAVLYLAANADAYATLVIDPVTVIYETLQDAAQLKRAGRRNDPDADLEMLDWQRIKRAYKALMTELVNLPIHVVVTAREKDEVEMRGQQSVKVGVKPDAEKGTSYYFDTVLRLVPTETGREAVVLKDRTGIHPLNARLAEPNFTALFGAAISAGKGATQARAVASDEAAAATDAQMTLGSWNRATVGRASVSAGIAKAAAAAAMEKVAEGRPVDELTPEDWQRVAEDLGLAAKTEQATA